MSKLLKEKYKTREGAAKRRDFENSLAKYEFEQGYKAEYYWYLVVEEAGMWRVQREIHDA